MRSKENPVKSVILANGTKEGILLRAKRDGEQMMHTPVRILVGNIVHLVRGSDVLRCALSMRFEPETNWPECPHCGREGWSVWMTASIRVHEVWDGEVDKPSVYPRSSWYILCLHCDAIVAHHSGVENPHGLNGVKEYVYDPADDVVKNFWPEIQPKRRRKRGAR